jgi:hypothetical protein
MAAVPPVPPPPPAVGGAERPAPGEVGPELPATPSFLGLSRREALARAQASGWEVRVSGVGYVSEQLPAPGSPLAPDRRLALRLASDGARRGMAN